MRTIELLHIWTNSQLTAATPPPPFELPNNPNAKSLKIANQSKYWLLLSNQNSNQMIDSIEPFSFVILPYQYFLSLSIDSTKGTSSLAPDNEFVDYTTIDSLISYQKGSTQFSGSSTVDISSAQVSMSATNVTVNNSGTFSFTDASGSITTANTSQTVLAANSARKYLLFQNISDTDMYMNFGAAATIGGAGSIWIAPAGGSIIFENSGIPSDAINLICSLQGKAFTCKWA